jgi:hypothetical protein
MDCNNYTGISLLSPVYIVFSSIIADMLQPHYEDITGNYQSVFHRGRNTTNQVFMIRTNYGKSL